MKIALIFDEKLMKIALIFDEKLVEMAHRSKPSANGGRPVLIIQNIKNPF